MNNSNWDELNALVLESIQHLLLFAIDLLLLYSWQILAGIFNLASDLLISRTGLSPIDQGFKSVFEIVFDLGILSVVVNTVWKAHKRVWLGPPKAPLDPRNAPVDQPNNPVDPPKTP